jgi:hypothetical protein
MPQACLDEGKGVDKIIAIVFDRLPDRLVYDNMGCKMGNRVEFLLREKCIKGCGICKISDQQPSVQDRLLVARGKIVVNDNVVTLLPEGPYHVTADIAGSAGNKDLHNVSNNGNGKENDSVRRITLSMTRPVFMPCLYLLFYARMIFEECILPVAFLESTTRVLCFTMNR